MRHSCQLQLLQALGIPCSKETCDSGSLVWGRGIILAAMQHWA